MIAATIPQAPKYFPDDLNLPPVKDEHLWDTLRIAPPLLVWALRDTSNPERMATFICQLHYWLEKPGVGRLKQGFKWIYNTAREWTQQFPWISADEMGDIRRYLESRSWIVSNNWNRTPMVRTKHSTLNYPLIARETGWNPLGLDINRTYPDPPGFVKGQSSSTRDIDDDIPLVYKTDPPTSDSTPPENDSHSSKTPKPSQLPNLFQKQNGKLPDGQIDSGQMADVSTTKNTFISTKTKANLKKENPETNQERKNTHSPEKVKCQGENLNKDLPKNCQTQDGAKCSAPDVDILVNEPNCSNEQKDLENPPREPYKWEIGWSNGEFAISPDFIRWRAKTHYEPQGAQWASGARGHAAAEIARKTKENPSAVEWMWQDFLEYAEKSADSAQVHVDAGMEPGLPTAFIEESRDTALIAAKLVKAKNAVRSSQEQKALRAQEQAALPPASFSDRERKQAELQAKLERYQSGWRNFKDKPALRKLLEQIIENVKNTPGLIMTDDGPVLDLNFAFGAPSDSPAKLNAPSDANSNLASAPTPSLKIKKLPAGDENEDFWADKTDNTSSDIDSNDDDPDNDPPSGGE